MIVNGLKSFFWLFVIAYLVMSAILVYHWQKYGGKSKKIFVVETVFIVGSLALIILAFSYIPK